MEYLYYLLGFIVVVVIFGVTIVPVGEFVVVERLGSFLKTIQSPGLYYKLPLIDRVRRVTKEEQTLEFNVDYYDIKIRYQVVDPVLYLYQFRFKNQSFHTRIEIIIKNFIEEKGIDITEDLTRRLIGEYGVQLNYLEIN